MNEGVPGVPSRTQQSWGAFISIVVIMVMVVVGAFYSWQKRVADNARYRSQGQASTTQFIINSGTSTPNH